MAGVEGRIFLIPNHKILMLEGDIRGMAFGGYGHYWEATGSGGITLDPVTFLAGYRSFNPDIHSSSSTSPSGVDVHLKGPIFSVQFRL